jgi:hypothetical protein
MTNLSKTTNIYADLSQSSYTGRPNPFPYTELKPSQKDQIDNNKSVKFTFPNAKYMDNQGNIQDASKVYLQPDSGSETAVVKSTGRAAGMGIPDRTMPQHTLLQNPDTGFNAYFVTDTPDPKEAKQAYLAIRGSDSYTDSHDLETDWLGNNLPFAVGSDEIPQARDAEQAMQGAIKELPNGTPLDITGHALGTMVAVQGATQLIKDKSSAINAIGNIGLFDGPDCTQSLKNMGLSSEQIKALSDKTTYFVNPLDLVSMLNRTAPLKDQFCQVHFIVPVDFERAAA